MLAAAKALVLAPFLLCSCGEPLVTGTTLDTPVFSMFGEIQPAPANSPLKIGILWVDPTQEQDSVSTVSGSELVDDVIDADGRYTLDFYRPPPDAAIHWLAPEGDSDAVLAFAWGEIVLYEDRDDDGTFEVGPVSKQSPMVSSDVYRGMATAHIVVYVEKPLTAEQNIIPELAGVATKAGYELGHASCEFTPPRLVRTDANEAALQMVEPSWSFPDLRRCLKPHPTEPATEQAN
jgi:hypothetical protein